MSFFVQARLNPFYSHTIVLIFFLLNSITVSVIELIHFNSFSNGRNGSQINPVECRKVTIKVYSAICTPTFWFWAVGLRK